MVVRVSALSSRKGQVRLPARLVRTGTWISLSSAQLQNNLTTVELYCGTVELSCLSSKGLSDLPCQSRGLSQGLPAPPGPVGTPEPPTALAFGAVLERWGGLGMPRSGQGDNRKQFIVLFYNCSRNIFTAHEFCLSAGRSQVA